MERTPAACSPLAILILGLFALCAAPRFASATDATGATVTATSEIRFTGSSPIHDWTGKAPPILSTLHEATDPGSWNGDLVIPIATLDSGEPARDANMRKMFHSDRWPDIRVAIRDIDPREVEESHEIIATVTIGEVTRDVITKVNGWTTEGDRTAFDASAVVSLKDFALEAPTVLGVIRVADEVAVNAHVVVSSSAPAPGAAQ